MYVSKLESPKCAATLTAAIELAQNGWLRPEERVVLLNTGAGIKYPETVVTDAPVLKPGDDISQEL